MTWKGLLLIALLGCGALQPLQARSIDDAAVVEPHEFHGLASYYNGVRYVVAGADGVRVIDEAGEFEVARGEWLAVAGRFNVLAVAGPVSAAVAEQRIELQADATPELTTKADLGSVDPVLDQVRYIHLWGWLAALTKAVEFALVQVHVLVNHWGWSICLFALLMSLLLSPVGWLTARLQRRVNEIKAVLEPQLREIKANHDGEEAHNRIMAAHKALNVSPFYTLKPAVGLLIQVPVLVAVFNALGEMPQLQGQAFLWVTDLAYPDAIATLPFTVPFFGPTLNLLPFLMSGLAIFVAFTYRNPQVSAEALKRQQRSVAMMAVVFFILFYPFPAAMVLYWTLANLIQVLQRQIVGG